MRTRPFIAFASALALAGCAFAGGRSAPAIPLVETVGDAAAFVAGRPTDSQNALAAIDAVGALGARMTALASDSTSGLAGRGALCRDGVQVAHAAAGSSEIRLFRDAACTQLARDERSRGTGASTSRTVLIYTPGRSAPIGIRRETTQTAGAHQTTSSALWVGNRRQSVARSDFTLLPGSRAGAFCQNSAAVGGAGLPSFDATLGWESSTSDSTVVDQRGGASTFAIATTQAGSSYVGPLGSVSIQRGASSRACPQTGAFRIGGGEPAGTYAIPIRATYRNGQLSNLAVNGATLAGGYRLWAGTVRNGMEAPSVAGAVVNGGIRVATLAADGFGDGSLTITSSGAQYRLVDWTIVR